MTDPLPVVVFDCNTLLQAVVSDRRPAAACLELFRTGRLMLALSPTVLAEVAEVLHRPELRQKLRRLTPERVDDLLQALVNEALLVPAPPRHIELPRDPKDEPYLDLAIAAGASYLITRDKDLLDLMNLDHKEGQEFRQRFPDLRIVNPVDYLNSVSSRLDSEQP